MTEALVEIMKRRVDDRTTSSLQVVVVDLTATCTPLSLSNCQQSRLKCSLDSGLWTLDESVEQPFQTSIAALLLGVLPVLQHSSHTIRPLGFRRLYRTIRASRVSIHPEFDKTLLVRYDGP